MMTTIPTDHAPDSLSDLLNNYRDEIIRHVESLVNRPRRRWLTVKEAAQYCGMSDASVRRMMRRGKITRHTPVAQRVLIDVDELDSAIRASGQKPRRVTVARRGA